MSFTLQDYEKNRELLHNKGLYRKEDEHDACGVGFVVSMDGMPRRDVVQKGISALKAVWHRGAVDSDGKTGDGAGVHLRIPHGFFRDYIRNSGNDPRDDKLAVGQIFLPRLNLSAQESARSVVESEVIKQGYYIYGWRQVPVCTSVLGDKAKSNRPEIEQVIIGNRNKEESDDDYERNLFFIRRRIENRILRYNITDFYICTLSCQSIIYKGMFLAQYIADFYPDLNHPDFISDYIIFHQRYSTNTYPQWKLAQPFRCVSHNGEINTIQGNINWMKSHEIRMASDYFGQNGNDIKPVIQPESSDSAALDAVFEVLVRAGRSAPWVKAMLVPEAAQNNPLLSDKQKAMFTYAAAVMEPWDGPAALVTTDGKWICAGMDRNGLRPFRYAVTSDGLFVGGSEAGMVPFNQEMVTEKGCLGLGKMIAFDLTGSKLYHDNEIKEYLANQFPYEEWIESIKPLDALLSGFEQKVSYHVPEELQILQSAFGISYEDLELILDETVKTGKEAIGSMGDHTSHAVLSKHYRPLSHFFRQRFSQVTNPPIDPLREAHTMSLVTRFGNLKNLLDESRSQVDIFTLESPIMTNGMSYQMCDMMQQDIVQIDALFPITSDETAFKNAVEKLIACAEEVVRAGCKHLIITDEKVSETHAPIPIILAVGGIHAHLVRQGLRSYVSLHARTGECLDAHYVAVLIGVGATTVNPYLAFEAIANRYVQGLYKNMSFDQAILNYKHALEAGLLKIISKSGISVISSYRGGYNFEAIGLSRALVSEFFPRLQSRISGIGLNGLRKKVLTQHKFAFDMQNKFLKMGGFYRFRQGGEKQALEGGIIHLLQTAVTENSSVLFHKYSSMVYEDSVKTPIALRDLLDFRKENIKPISVEQVESVTQIRKKFVTPGMSLGALSPEAHETLTIAMNRIGAKSDSGEGGEDPIFARPRANGDNPCTAIKQVASGRFGVTAEYLNNCRELEIKIAQGAKPGEGGQLPAFKVTELIARLRHSTKGVTLISPPPHHDIYSIEDLSQLIYDLKQINPKARVCVKLVSQAGIGTVAAGVVKAKADIILISGNVGGTGASPQTSIKFAGSPWETGLAEVNQVLTLNGMRHKVKLRTDGGLKTGRDIVIAAMLGAEEYGIGTAALVAMGCLMVRQCHSNTCPVGVCTQDEELRKRFGGSPEKVIHLFTLIAEEVRDILASLGLKSLQEAVGRTDLLQQVNRGWFHLDDLDLNPLLLQVDSMGYPRHCILNEDERNEISDNIDRLILQDASPLFERGEKMELSYNVVNTDRAIGTRIASEITRKFGMWGLPEQHLTLQLKGSAGQSLGAFIVQGMKICVTGEANDYVGKGLSGGMIIISPPRDAKFLPCDNVIIGNTVLYGATSGYLFASGRAGERFAVRNSGAITVIEGCGANGCEYMTGGTVVILGEIGINFGAGMTGGMAFIYDPKACFATKANGETIIWDKVQTDYWKKHLKELIVCHYLETKSEIAGEILANFDKEVTHFIQICPKDMLDKLQYPLALVA